MADEDYDHTPQYYHRPEIDDLEDRITELETKVGNLEQATRGDSGCLGCLVFILLIIVIVLLVRVY